MGKARLLVVEDDSDISNMLKIYFSGLGYDVDVALRGYDALDKTRQVLPHLIILDIMMPKKTGVEVCNILRSQSLFQEMRPSFCPAPLNRYKSLEHHSDPPSQMWGMEKRPFHSQ